MIATLPPPMHTSRNVTRATRRSREDGIAIILVLAFIVILTGLVFAFFSRTITERQVANSSLSQSKADVLARSAADVIIGDFKQEIVNGSSPSPTGYSLYVPTSNVYMVPQTSGTPSAATSGSPPPIPNLVRRSVRADPLASPAPAAPGIRAVTTAASAVNSTTDVSGNGRSVGLARWNSHYLIPRHAAQLSPPDIGLDKTADSTPISPLPAPYGPSPSPDPVGFTPPDWVMVTSTGPKVLTVPDATTVGRYAYTIYDEGGLLDVNVAGYPSQTNATQAASKSSLAFADLSVLPDAIPKTPVGTSQVDQIVGWRNYATLSLPPGPSPSPSPPSGNFPNYNVSLQNANNYWSNLLSSTSGFLTVNPNPYPSPTPANGLARTDQAFTSRQALLNFRRGMGGSAFTQNALQYLGTFTRDINQPSYLPNPNAPKILAAGSGGNDSTGYDASALSTATNDTRINPSFPAVRVKTAKTSGRNDGSDFVMGEPLVKQRFALNRLAWLTYKGPSQTVYANNPTDPIITALIAQGYTSAFLQQGTPTNITNYFGLRWQADTSSATGLGDGTSKWFYNAHLYGPQGPGVVGTGSKGSIMKLGDISALTVTSRIHEPDFFELLKASVTAGSLAKARPTNDPLYPTGKPGSPELYQTGKDNSVDSAIIQLGANIIDQFDSDGIPTRIVFDDGTFSTPQEYRGIEDLPYFYRVRKLYFPVRESVPSRNYKPKFASNDPDVVPGDPVIGSPRAGDRFNKNSIAPTKEDPFTDSGMAVSFYAPEIWNPHSWNTSNPSTGIRPTVFRFCAVNASPGVTTPPNPDTNATTAIGYVRSGGSSTVGPPISVIPTNFLHPLSFTQANTGLVFTIPFDAASAATLADPTKTRLDLFREPTFLIKPGVPAGSNLHFSGDPAAITGSEPSNQVFNSNVESANPAGESLLQPYIKVDSVSGYKGIKSIDTPGLGYTDTNNLWLGIYTGSFPLKWSDAAYVITANAIDFAGGGTRPFNYFLQYRDPISATWVTYDEKFTGAMGAAGQNTGSNKNPLFLGFKLMGNNSDGDNFSFVDPRTSRFSRVGNGFSYSTGGDMMSMWTTAGAQSNAMQTERSDEKAGNYNQSAMPSVKGWKGGGSNPDNLFPGLLAQNNPSLATVDPKFTNWFADADGVVRRGMSAHVPPSASSPAQPAAPRLTVSGSTAASGIPLAAAMNYNGTTPPAIPPPPTQYPNEIPSRPIVLNRPFRSVAELGYVFSGTPWRNLDFFTPESGNAAMMDVFCINPTTDPNALVAGKVNLNTRQYPVLQAILAGAYVNEFAPSSLPIPDTATTSQPFAADAVAKALVARTADVTNAGPLTNVSELVGKWQSGIDATTGAASTTPYAYDGSRSYTGFSGTTATASAPPSTPANLSSLLYNAYTSASAQGTKRVEDYNTNNVQRYRESVMRPLSNVGTTRVWNLMIDLVAQTGRYPQNAAAATNPLAAFVVEGEQRYWVHIAIDRLTGQVIDKQIEVVKE